MPLKPSDVRIPPERISARVRSRPSTGQSNSQKSTPTTARSVPRKLRPSAQTLVPRAQSQLAGLKEENIDEDNVDLSGNESDDDDTVFKSRRKLPASSVQRWKLAELTGK